MKTLALNLLLFLSINIFAQQLPEILAPTPSASSLIKANTVHDDFSKGLYNLAIPFYEIETPCLTLPIFISYHSKGIPVSETASNVGAGWNLSAGGSIVRQVRGKADDHARGYLNSNPYDNFFTSFSKRNFIKNASLSPFQSYDMTPDKFIISLPNINEEFIYDHESKDPLMKSLSNLKIDKTYYSSVAKISGFEVIDSDGTKYYFKEGGKRELMQIISIYNNNPSPTAPSVIEDIIMSWDLEEITLINGDKIYFEYFTESYETFERIKDEKVGNGFVSTVNKYQNTETHIKKIIYNDVEVKFYYLKNREDILGGNSKTLDEIKVFRTNGSRSNTSNTSVLSTIKHFKLSNSYFISEDDDNITTYFSPSNSNYATKRLRLDEVIQYPSSDVELDPLVHKFNYFSSDTPNKFSTSVDYWGYYNGASNGHTLIDFLDDRTVNTQEAKKGILESIEYPNGSIRKFYYEHQSGVLSDKIKDYETIFINPTIEVSSFLSSYYEKHVVDSRTFINDSLTVGNNPRNFKYALTKTSFAHPDVNEDPTHVSYLISVESLDGNSDGFNIDLDNCVNGDNNFNCDGNLHSLPSGNYLSEGEYVIKAVIYNGVDFHPVSTEGFRFELVWDEESTQSNELMGPGLRISKIETYDKNKPEEKDIKLINYRSEIPDSGTSGIITSMPNFFYKFNCDRYVYPDRCENFENVSISIGNYFNSVFDNYLSSNLTYNTVVIKDGYIKDSQTQFRGEKILEFSVNSHKNTFHKYPFSLPNSSSWLDSKLLLEKSYLYQDSNKKIVKETKYNYTINYTDEIEIPLTKRPLEMSHNILKEKSGNQIGTNYDNISTFRSGNYWKIPLSTFYYEGYPFVDIFNPINYNVFYLSGSFVKLRSIEEKSFFYDNGLRSEIYNKIDFGYNPSNYNYSKKSETKYKDSDEIIHSVFKYSSDKNQLLGLTEEESLAIDQLLLKNQVSVPIQTESYIEETLLSSQRSNYKNWSGNITATQSVETSNGGSSLEERVIYHDYDDYGNPLEVSKTDGTRIIYIWGYNDTQPIAKLINASYHNLSNAQQNAIDAIKADSDADINTSTEDALRTSLENLRDVFPSAQVTTYTYDPLIGLTSITDARGETTYYEYDDFNRLKTVKDAEGNLLEETEYNYSN